MSYTVNAVKIDRCRHKKEMVNKWMNDDRQRQDRLDNAVELNNVNCPLCNLPMHSIMKTLENYINEPMRVLFFL